MSTTLTFWDRLRAEAIPTGPQALGVTCLSIIIILAAQSRAILTRFGISAAAISDSQSQLHARFDVILRSPIVSNLALITFWATLGLIAYLISWGVYSIFIEARNEVTLNTAYVNRTDYNHPGSHHWRSAYETLGLKAAAAIGLTILISSLGLTISFWMALSTQFLELLSVITGLEAILAVLGLALNLYLVLLFIQLTFTPWYRIQAFTEV